MEPDALGTQLGAHIPLPRSLAETPGGGRMRARAVFNNVAALYDRARPGYPGDLYDELFARVDFGVSTRVVEVGCGTGQATRVLAERGCRIRCVELGPDLAAIARRNVATFPNVEIEVCAFEDAEIATGSADVVFSAMAFHWIDPAYGFPRAAELLADGGHLVLITNAHVAGGTQGAITPEVQEIHRRLVPDVKGWEFPSPKEVAASARARGDIAAVWSRVDRCFNDPPDVSSFFEEPFVATYPWTATYDRDGYLAWLATQSTYALLDSGTRERVLAEIGGVIDRRLNGTITKPFVAVLTTARRR